jgi:rSAM/selenodomain-associated transferase 1
MRPILVIMVKEPRPGRVKTRLGRDIGMVAAAWWFRHQTRALTRRLRDPRWDLVLAVSPDVEGLTSSIWPEDIIRVAQGSGDLGCRMKRLFQGLPKGPVCIIGADIPDVSKRHIAQAFAKLGSCEAVFGPAPDGGYWLVGMKRVRAVSPKLFTGVRWSSADALADSVASMEGLRVGYVESLRDVDTVDDLG